MLDLRLDVTVTDNSLRRLCNSRPCVQNPLHLHNLALGRPHPSWVLP